MKTFALALITLLLTGLCCFGYGHWASSVIDEMLRQVECSQTAIQEGEPETAERCLTEVLCSWNRHKRMLAAAIPHNELSQVGASLARAVALMAQGDERTDVWTELGLLHYELSELRRRERPLWENLF